MVLSAQNGVGELDFTFYDAALGTRMTCAIAVGAQSCQDTKDNLFIEPGNEIYMRVFCSTKCVVPYVTAGISFQLQPNP